MTVSLTPVNKQKILLICVKLLATEQAPIRPVAQLLETFFSSFIGVPYGKLCYRSLERCKTKFLVISKGNFDKIMHVSKEAIQDILWWKHNIIDVYAINVRGNPSFGWGASLGQFSTEQRQRLINILEQKAARFGFRTLCKNEFKSDILIQIDNTSAISAINKMGSVKSI